MQAALLVAPALIARAAGCEWRFFERARSLHPKPDEPEPNRQKTSSVVRKIVGRSTDVRPCKCSRASREKCRNPLGLEAFCLRRLGRWFYFGTLQFFSQIAIAKTQLVSD